MRKLLTYILLSMAFVILLVPNDILKDADNMVTALAAPMNSVVLIHCISPDGESSGSGFFVTKDGGIITAAHVVDGAEIIIVELVDGEKFVADVTKIRVDLDCAIIDISGKDYSALKLAEAKLGETVRVIGAPMGKTYFPYITKGIVSKERVLNPLKGDVSTFAIDAAVNPGNSGGPVINDANECIGIVLAFDTRGTGLSFVLSSSELKKLLE